MKKRNVKSTRMFIIFVVLVFCLGQAFGAVCGDVDSSGDVDIVDALLIAQDYVNLNPANFWLLCILQRIITLPQVREVLMFL